MNTHLHLAPVGLVLAVLTLAAQPVRAVEIDPEAVDRARSAFVERMVAEHGFDSGELAAILERADIRQDILDAISRPAERVLAWHEYRDIFLTDTRIAGGVEFWRQHAAEIAHAGESFGVASEVLVAILGVETNYGGNMGSYRVVDALATLAFAYPPRSAFFTSELEEFFLLAREEGLDPEALLGSYAGAMGAGQFISSSFRAWAMDGNADGRRDLWGDWEDVLASVANYFSSHGWRRGETVVERAAPGDDRSPEASDNSMNLNDSLASVRAAGYRIETDLPADTPVTLLSLAGADGQEYWVGFHNFHVITRYNRSVMYALAVHQLGRAIRAGVEAAGIEVADADAETADVGTAGAAATGMEAADIGTSGAAATGMEAADIRTAGAATAGVGSAGIDAVGATTTDAAAAGNAAIGADSTSDAGP